jgi:hypothetical protein
VPWGDPAKDWANLLSFDADPKGEKDASPALQRAIDSGKRTIYLPPAADFRFEGQVEIRGPVQRIIGLEGRFTAVGEPVWKMVDGQHPTELPDSPVVVIERLTHRSGGEELKIRQESKRTLVVSSSMGFSVEGHGTGDLFIDDLAGHLDRVARSGQLDFRRKPLDPWQGETPRERRAFRLTGRKRQPMRALAQPVERDGARKFGRAARRRSGDRGGGRAFRRAGGAQGAARQRRLKARDLVSVSAIA